MFYRDTRVAKDAAERAEGDFLVKRNRNGKTLRIAGVAEPDVAAFLPHGITELAEGAKSFHLCKGSSPETTGSFGVIA